MLTSKQMTAKQYLKQAYRLNELIKNSLTEIENLRAMSTRIASPDLTKERVSKSKSTDAPFENAVNKLVDLEATVAEQADEYIQLHDEIRDMIKLIDNSDYVLVLQNRFLLFHKWEQIAKDMNITYMWVTVLYKRALEALTDILTAKGKATQ